MQMKKTKDLKVGNHYLIKQQNGEFVYLGRLEEMVED